MFVANSYEGNGNYSTGTVGMLLGNGDGTFQVAVSYGSGGYQPISMALGDINGDGKADLLVANKCRDDNTSNTCLASVDVLAGNGDGTFQHSVSYSAGGAFAASIVLTDINGDDKLDAVVSNQCVSKISGDCRGNLALLLGKGDGSFVAAKNYSSGGYTPYSDAVSDVNGDGKPDVLVASLCPSSGCVNGTIGLLLGNGDGSFQPVVSYNSGGYQAASVAVSDVNRDGRPDLLVANECANSNCVNASVGVLLQNSDGSFQNAVSFGSGGYRAFSLAVSDVNRDGKPDVVVANQCVTNANCANGNVGVLLGNGDGTFRSALTYSSGGEFAFSVTTGDINSDGKPDLLVTNVDASTTNQSNGTIAVLLGNGDGTFQPTVTYGSGGQSAYTAALADVNGDGKLDALVTNQCAIGNCNTADLGVLLGNGDGTFQSAVLTPVFQQTGIQQLAIADFDGNGTLDVASGGGGFLLLGNGDGTFQSPLLLGADGPGIAIGDFNLDGKPDLAVGGVTILLNISTPTNRLSTTTTLTSSPNPSILGQAVTFVATVNTQSGGFPGGTVTFKDGANTVGTAFVSTCNCASRGTASLPLSTLGLGSHTMTAAYGGDVTFAGSTSTALSQTVNKVPSSTALAVSPNLSTFGELVTMTATVTSSGGVPTGTVSFLDGATVLGSGSLNGSGQASLSTSALGAGSHAISASYGGNGNFSGSTSAVLTETVNKANTTTAISAQSPNPSVAGQAVTVNFAVTAVAPGSGTPTGNVTVSDGVGNACTGAVASGGCSLIFATAGAKTLKSTYAGDSNFNTSTSAGLTHNVRDFSISSSPTSQAIKAGQKTTYKLTVTPLNGFTGSISLSCAGVPASSTCSFSAGSISLTGSSSANSTVTVQTSKTTAKGTYSLTLTGQFGTGTPTTGGLTHSVKVSLLIQ